MERITLKQMAQEKLFEKKVKEFLEGNGCWVLKTWSNGTQRKGIPDLLVCCNGYFLGIELKAPNGKPSELQKWNVQKIRDAGGIAIVLYPRDYEIFKKLVEKLCGGRYADAKSDEYLYFDKK